MITPVYCRFPDEATALAVASELAKAADPTLPGDYHSTVLPSDGYLFGVYYNIEHVDAPLDEAGTPVPGYHVIGLWRAQPETLPEPLASYAVAPWGAEFG